MGAPSSTAASATGSVAPVEDAANGERRLTLFVLHGAQPPNREPAAMPRPAANAAALIRLPPAGWTIRRRSDPSPQATVEAVRRHRDDHARLGTAALPTAPLPTRP